MQFTPLVEATLLKRYKRFLADVQLEDGRQVTAHCANTGAMTGCCEPGSRVWLSESDNPKRKYRYSWQLLQTAAGDMVCIHSALANKIVAEGVQGGAVAPLVGYSRLASEVKYGDEGSRIDLLLQGEAGDCYVEVKCVTLQQAGGLGLFPDAVSTRGAKHLRELIRVREQGHRAVLFFCSQHTGIRQIAPADLIDQRYAETLREALAAGVEVLAYATAISPFDITLDKPIEFLNRQPR